MKHNITIGADPELFAFSNDVPVSVHNIIPGTKWSPCKVPRGAIQVDGVAAEFNIDPAPTRKIFMRNMKHVTRILENFVKNHNLVLRAEPVVHFNEEYFKALPDETKALGCEPDYNAYTQKANDKPETTKPMRTGSGHVHVGWEGCNKDDPSYINTVCEMVKDLDFVLYRQASFWDKDTERMELYGKPGAFRFKPYGFEYRTLSNRWLSHDGLMAFVYDATYTTIENALNGKHIYKGFDNSGSASYHDYMVKNNYPLVQDYIKNAA